MSLHLNERNPAYSLLYADDLALHSSGLIVGDTYYLLMRENIGVSWLLRPSFYKRCALLLALLSHFLYYGFYWAVKQH